MAACMLLAGNAVSSTDKNSSVDHPPFVCGTGDLLQRMSGRLVPEVALRPPDGSFMKTSIHFRVHYEDSLLHAYADLLLQSAEESYSALIDGLGCQAPPDDSPDGGDGRTDFYIIPAASVSFYGRTVPERHVPSGTYPNGYTSYVEIIDTLSTTLLPAIVVHEYFHVIQLGYDKDESVSFLEMISVWSEDYLYDDVNNYLQYLTAFFLQPQVPLMNWTYNNVVWAKFLSENFGDTVIRDILHRCGIVSGANATGAMDQELAGFGTDLSAEFARFTLWNYFTGERNDGLHYEEGGLYPEVWVGRDTECLPQEQYSPMADLGALSSNYITYLGDHASVPLRIDIILDPGAEWIVGVHRFIAGGVSTTTHYYPVSFGWDPHTIMVDDWGVCDSLLVIPNLVSTTGTSFEYFISARHQPSAAPPEPYVLILDRDDCRRPFDGVADGFTVADGESYPWAAACNAKSVRYLMSDSLPGDLSLCGAVFVIGGFDSGGCNLTAAELQRLVDFMDSGGDCYLESARIGAYIDPGVATPAPEEEAFWNRFGCSFLPGEPAETGNVSFWRTVSTLLPAYEFDYDFRGAPDNGVGSLVPGPGTDSLIVDQGGTVRGTIMHGPNESERICATVLLGGSTGSDPQSFREAYLRSVLDLFNTIVPALAVRALEYEQAGGAVSFTGELTGWSGETILLSRHDTGEPGVSRTIAVTVTDYGSVSRLSATDTPPPGTYRYELVAVAGSARRSLWEGTITAGARVPGFDIVSVAPNPSNGVFQITFTAPYAIQPSIGIFDPAGRLLYSERRRYSEGIHSLAWDGTDRSGAPLPSGVYFLRIESDAGIRTKKLVLLRAFR